jgi:hypothetical protein
MPPRRVQPGQYSGAATGTVLFGLAQDVLPDVLGPGKISNYWVTKCWSVCS